MSEWLDDFKIALIEENIEKLARLHLSMPNFERLKDIECAKALIGQALPLFIKENNKIKESLEQLKKAKKFHQNSTFGKEKFSESF